MTAARQRKEKGRAFAESAMCPNPTIMALDYTANHCQANACDLEFFHPVQPLEYAKEFTGVVHIHPRPLLRTYTTTASFHPLRPVARVLDDVGE